MSHPLHASTPARGEDEPCDGFECAICLELLCEPVQLPCRHSFCRSCLISDAVREHSCPLCRGKFQQTFDARTARVHQELEDDIRRAYPVKYSERLAMRSARTLYLRIGNRFKILTSRPQNCYRWTVFVEVERLATCAPELIGKRLCDLVEYVSFDSVPGAKVFKCGSYSAEDHDASLPQYHVYNQPYELTATGWKITATVTITIFWKSWLLQQPTTFQHTPEFVGEEMTDKGWVYSVDFGETAIDAARVQTPEATLGAAAPAVADASGGFYADYSLESPASGMEEAPSAEARSETARGVPEAIAAVKPRRMRRLSVAPKVRRSVRAMQSVVPSRVSRLFL